MKFEIKTQYQQRSIKRVSEIHLMRVERNVRRMKLQRREGNKFEKHLLPILYQKKIWLRFYQILQDHDMQLLVSSSLKIRCFLNHLDHLLLFRQQDLQTKINQEPLSNPLRKKRKEDVPQMREERPPAAA